MNTVAQLNAVTDAERDEAARWAKARQLGQYKGTGIYPVTVGGYEIGQVRKVGRSWRLYDADGMALRSGTATYVSAHTRTDAVDHLARTDAGVQAYRAAAREGVFGTKAEATQKARVEAVLAALDVELAEMDEQYAEESTEAPMTAEEALTATGDVDADTEALEQADIDQVTPRDLDRDRRARMRPSDVQLAVVERMIEADPMTESVVVPLVFPGKDRGVWTMGQEVVAVPSYSAVNDRIDYSTCRNQAAMVGDEYLREHHTDQGGTYAYVRIEVDPTAPEGFSWFVVEDGKVPPMLKIV